MHTHMSKEGNKGEGRILARFGGHIVVLNMDTDVYVNSCWNSKIISKI